MTECAVDKEGLQTVAMPGRVVVRVSPSIADGRKGRRDILTLTPREARLQGIDMIRMAALAEYLVGKTDDVSDGVPALTLTETQAQAFWDGLQALVRVVADVKVGD